MPWPTRLSSTDSPRRKDYVELNVGTIDRALRILAGLVLVALAGFGHIAVWGFIGVIPIVAGMIEICPLHTLLGTRTTSR